MMSQPPRGRLPEAPVPRGLRGKSERLDVHSMFVDFNRRFFADSLQGVYVEYSPRMTLCAGTCMYRGAMGGCRIALSEPLLLRRPPSDTRDTLLHEMIHASLFLKHGLRRDGPDGHGPLFLSEAERVNRLAGSNITVYHNFADEVDAQRIHWWRCVSCGRVVKRAMNRAPGPTDIWWENHVAACGGVFEKTHEPPPKPPPPRFGAVGVSSQDAKDATQAPLPLHNPRSRPVLRVQRIDEMLQSRAQRPRITQNVSTSADAPAGNALRKGQVKSGAGEPRSDFVFSKVCCPICNSEFPTEAAVNQHLDEQCLAPAFVSQPAMDTRRAEPKGANHEEAGRELGSKRASRWDRFVDDGPRTMPGAAGEQWSAEGAPGSTASRKRPRESASADTFQSTGPGPLKSSSRQSPVMVDCDEDVIVLDEDDLERVADASETERTAKQLRARLGKDDVFDFAIGRDNSCLPTDVIDLISCVRGSKASAGEPAALPELPLANSLSDEDALLEVSKRVGLWHPGSDAGEAPFASAAARRGMSASDFMSTLLKHCTRDGLGFRLSPYAVRLFDPPGGRSLPSERIGEKTSSRPSSRDKSSSDDLRRNGSRDVEIVSEKGTKQKDAASGFGALGDASGSHQKSPRVAVFGVPNGRVEGIAVKGDHESFAENSRSVGGRGRDERSGKYERVLLADPSRCETAQPGVRVARGGEPAPSRRVSRRTTTCPMCEKDVPRDGIDAHLEICLAVGADEEVMSVGDCDVPRVVDRQEGEVAGPAQSGRLCPEPKDSSSTSGAQVACPICGRLVDRQSLERHTSSCLQASGLDGAFDL